MDFEVVGPVRGIETIAAGRAIRQMRPAPVTLRSPDHSGVAFSEVPFQEPLTR